MAQLPAAKVDDVQLRKKFGAMISAAISDSSAANGCSSGVAALPSSKGSGSTKTRADANVCL